MLDFASRLLGGVQPFLSPLPTVLPVALAGFSVVSMLLLVLGKFELWAVWLLGGLAASVVSYYVLRSKYVSRPGSKKEQAICDVLVVLGVIVWGIFNSFYASEHLFTNRDPATYANASVWLAKHDSLVINTPDVFGQSANITNESPGFAQPKDQPNVVHAQGEHLLPALLGAVGKLLGQDLLLRVSPWIGALALLAVYGFARLLLKPGWALSATATLSVTLPFIHFSRDTYTEPLMMLFVFGGLTLLWQAQKSGSRNLWFLAGLIFGAGILSRIDMYVSVIGLIAAVAVIVALAKGVDRKVTLINAGLFVLGMIGPAVLSWVDLTQLSLPYFVLHKHLIAQELIALFIVGVIGAAGVFISWRTQFITWLDKFTKPWRNQIIVVLILVAVAVLASRPLWYTAYNSTGQVSDYYAAIQASEGSPPEPRAYTELTTYWISWYVGPLLALLGVVGLTIVAVRMTKKDGVYLAPFVFVVIISTLVYLINPNVAPDQLWAARRMLPVAIPGLLILAILTLQYTANIWAGKRSARVAFISIAVLAVMAVPLLVSRPFVKTRDINQKPLFAGLCKALPSNAAVLWIGDGQYYNLQATRSFCNVPVSSYKSTVITKAELAKAAKSAISAGYVPIVAVFGGERHLLGEDQTYVQKVSVHSYNEMMPRLFGPPNKFETKSYEFFIGHLDSDGRVKVVK
jgi:4-amino-4-deoxy-L-arabinose transferase-like glycosyltransferase